MGVAMSNWHDVLDILSLLTPYDVPGERKVRVGPANDGGYIMLDRLRPDQNVLSYGLGWDVRFEYDLAERGHTVFMFDHTIERPALAHERFRFVREGIAASPKPDEGLSSLEDHTRRLAAELTEMILKIDVEGAEWDVLATAPGTLLDRFEQIVCEFHAFHLLGEATWRSRAARALRNLNQRFTLFHVHANNCAPISVVSGVPVATVLEASYIRSELVERQGSTRFFPTFLDAPNNPRARDHLLWFFPFMPTDGQRAAASVPEILDGTIDRIDRQHALALAESELRMMRQKNALKTAAPASTPGEPQARPAGAVASTVSIAERPRQPAGSKNILILSVHPGTRV